MEDANVRVNQLHAEYLLSATDRLSGISSNALLCHWNILLGDVMEMNEFAFTRRKTDEKICCMHCLSPWRNGMFSVRVMPKAKRGKKMRKLVRMMEEHKELSKVQKKLAKAMHSGPVVIVNCKICCKSTKFKVPQDVPVKGEVCTPQNGMDIEKIKKFKKLEKKKRKKLKKMRESAFSGLNPVVLTKIHGSKGYQNVGNKVDKFQKNNGVIAENVQHNVINAELRKSKMDGDLVSNILESDSGKVIEPKTEDAIQVNPILKTSKGHEFWKFLRSNGRLFNSFHSTREREKGSKSFLKKRNKQKKGQNMVDEGKKFDEKKKKILKLNMWKRLIANEEAQSTNTSSLQDFLSAL